MFGHLFDEVHELVMLGVMIVLGHGHAWRLGVEKMRRELRYMSSDGLDVLREEIAEARTGNACQCARLNALRDARGLRDWQRSEREDA